jgi:hypothetical protein
MDDDLDAFAPEQQSVDLPPLPILPPLTKQQKSMTAKRTLLAQSTARAGGSSSQLKRKAAPMGGHGETGHLQSQQKCSAAVLLVFVGARLRTCGISTAKAEVVAACLRNMVACG